MKAFVPLGDDEACSSEYYHFHCWGHSVGGYRLHVVETASDTTRTSRACLLDSLWPGSGVILLRSLLQIGVDGGEMVANTTGLFD